MSGNWSDPWRNMGGKGGKGGGGSGGSGGSGGGGHGGGGGTPQPPTPNPWGSTQENAFDLMLGQLKDYGLDTLAPVLKQLILGGDTDAATLSLKLQDTSEWKTRFAGNELLRQKGLPVLSVPEYLSVERSYAQVMKNYGLPEGFYDQPADFAKFIGNSVSANELNQRAQMYSDLANRDDPAVRQQLTSMGLGHGDLIAYYMDSTRAFPLVAQKYQTALVGAAARRSGLNADNAGYLAQLGVSEQQAVQGYGVISQDLPTTQRLGDIYGQSFTQADFEKELFAGNGQAAAKRGRLASQERANFSGTSGIQPGSIQGSAAGSY